MVVQLRSQPFFSLKSDRLLEQISWPKKVENFSYCFTKACLKGTEEVMPVLDPLQRGVELPLQFPGDADAEDLADLVPGQTPQPNLAGTFEDAMDGEVALEDEIAAVLDLVDGVEPVQVHRASLPVGELRS